MWVLVLQLTALHCCLEAQWWCGSSTLGGTPLLPVLLIIPARYGQQRTEGKASL